MNWKPAFVGALVVIVAGFGVGYAVDRTGKADTVTVVSTVTVGSTVTVPGPGTGTDDGSGTTSTPSEAPKGRATPLSALQDEVRTYEVTLGSPPSITIGHTTFPNGTTADDLFGYDCEAATAEYTVASTNATFVADVGWTQDSDSSASATFQVRINRVDGEQLYSETFAGPGEPIHVSEPLGNAYKLILMWERTDPDSCDLIDGTFGLANARIVAD